MPEIGAHGLDVSVEEQRYLRRSFRRFALPYLALAVVLVALGAWMGSRGSSGGAAGDSQDVRAELEALRADVQSLSEEVERVGARLHASAERVSALEARGGSAGKGDLASLESELRSVRNRMFDLEKRIEREAAPGQIAALTERLGRLERSARAEASGGSAPPAALDPAPPRAEAP